MGEASQTSPTGRPEASVWVDAAPGEMDITPGPQPWALRQVSCSPNPCLLSYGGGAQTRCPQQRSPLLKALWRGGHLAAGGLSPLGAHSLGVLQGPRALPGLTIPFCLSPFLPPSF